MPRYGPKIPEQPNIWVPIPSVSERNARRILQLKQGDKLKITAELEKRAYTITTEAVNNSRLFHLLDRAAEQIKRARSNGQNVVGSVDLRLFAGMISQLSWPQYSIQNDADNQPFTHKNARLIQLVEYGCVVRKTQRELARHVGIPNATLERAINFLKIAKVIISVEPGGIWFDPLVVWRGDYNLRLGAIDVLLEKQIITL